MDRPSKLPEAIKSTSNRNISRLEFLKLVGGYCAALLLALPLPFRFESRIRAANTVNSLKKPASLGAITQRLGIGNTAVPNASAFASVILGLPTGTPIYQQQLIHSQLDLAGPAQAAAEWCGLPDDESGQATTIRQISAHDTQFSRRNLSDPPYGSLVTHRDDFSDQIYFAGNEPDAGSKLQEGDGCTDDCWNPRDRLIDASLEDCFPNPEVQFWEAVDGGFVDLRCPTVSDYQRIRPEALAYVYLRLKRETEELGRGHIVLPPSSSDARLGVFSAYWEAFYDAVYNGVSAGDCPAEPGISPEQLFALHAHHYSLPPNPQLMPLMSAAWTAVEIRVGADWYRGRYLGGNPIPADLLLSEMGVHWQIPDNDLRWAGGWSSFRQGLSWWNTWLAWLTRWAPEECNLLGWDTGAHTVRACIHEPHRIPYATDQAANARRDEWVFSPDAWKAVRYANMPVKQLLGLEIENTGYAVYQNSFSALNSIAWGGRHWRRTPFGACYAVWSQVGAEPVTQDLNTGWVYNTTGGVAGEVAISLPEGYSTVYFPLIKDMGNFDPRSIFWVRWLNRDGATYDHGLISLADFDDSNTFSFPNYPGYTQNVHSAMIFPVVCKSGRPRRVRLQVWRNLDGGGVWLGRPIVLPGACSWILPSTSLTNRTIDL